MSNVKIPYADLSHTFLNGINFGQAQLDSVDFRNSDLRGMDFSQSTMNKTIFGQLAVLKGHTQGVLSVSISPDGKKIVSGSYDNSIRVWDTDTGREILPPLQANNSYVFSVAFSPDGKKIASGSSDKSVRVWDAETG